MHPYKGSSREDAHRWLRWSGCGKTPISKFWVEKMDEGDKADRLPSEEQSLGFGRDLMHGEMEALSRDSNQNLDKRSAYILLQSWKRRMVTYKVKVKPIRFPTTDKGYLGIQGPILRPRSFIDRRRCFALRIIIREVRSIENLHLTKFACARAQESKKSLEV